MPSVKKTFVCTQCGKKTSATNAKRIKVRLCAACASDFVTPKEPAKASGTTPAAKASIKARQGVAKLIAPAKGRKRTLSAASARAPSDRMVDREPVGVPGAALVPAIPSVPPVVPVVASAPVASTPYSGPNAAALDARITETREAMNRLAADLSGKRIELAALHEQRRALGPPPRAPRDLDAPRRTTLLDAAAQVLADAAEPMQAKAIWKAIVERCLWQSPNGGKTPFATLAAAMMRDMAAKGAGSRFAKAGRGLFAVRAF